MFCSKRGCDPGVSKKPEGDSWDENKVFTSLDDK